MVESSRRERSSNERRNPSPLNTPRFFPREEGEKYFSSIPSSLLLSSFRFIRSPVGESTPENREALARNQATTRLEPKRRVERKLHPFPSNRINRGVLAAVDRGASSLRRFPRNLEMRNATTTHRIFPFVRFDEIEYWWPFFCFRWPRSIGERLHEITINEGASTGRWRKKGCICMRARRQGFE